MSVKVLIACPDVAIDTMVLVELLTSLEEGPYVSVAVFPSSGATREVLDSLRECGDGLSVGLTIQQIGVKG